MSFRHRSAASAAANRAPFDDRRTSSSIGTLATAFVVGGVATWLALGAGRTARAQLPGPADGAPLM
ncbi:hypothetical protein, partial [Rhizobium redzepovicii]